VFTDALLEKEGPAALVASAALFLSARAAEPGRSWRSALGMGLAWGVVALLRANALVLAPLGILWWLGWSGAGGWRSRLMAGVVYGVGFAAALAPVTAINWAVSHPHELILTTWQAGPNFYIGNGPEATGTYAAPAFVEANPAHEAADFAAEARRRSGRDLSPSRVSRFWLMEGLRRWGEAPLASLRLLGWKLILLANNVEIPDNQDMEVVRLVAAPALGLAVLSFGGLAPWATLGLGLGRPARTPFWWFLVGSTLAGLASTAAFFVVGRYRIPWVPGLLLLGAAGAVDATRRALSRHWRSLASRLLRFALPAAALAWWPIPEPAPDRWGHAAIELALAHFEAGQLEPGIDALDDARALGPGPSARVAELLAGPYHDRLATLIGLRLALARDLGGAPAWRRARWLRQLPEGRVEARRLLESALATRPEDPGLRRE
ncbi:MAG: hypothetical protein IRY99_26665, partial [Isosphaeraceae bacterium]|nr:hypothetical protein [Isosphaeraceae bacterium]